MVTTLGTKFPEFVNFWADCKRHCLDDWADPQARIASEWWAWKMYTMFRNDWYIGDEGDFIGRFITFIAMDCEWIRRRDDVYSTIFNQFVFAKGAGGMPAMWDIKKTKQWKKGTMTETQGSVDEQYNEPLFSAPDFTKEQLGSHLKSRQINKDLFGEHPIDSATRSDWTKTVSIKGSLGKTPDNKIIPMPSFTTQTKEGIMAPVPDIDPKTGQQKIDPDTKQLMWLKDKGGNMLMSWQEPTEVEVTQDRAGIARVLNIFQQIEVKLEELIPKYWALFHTMYTPRGNFVWDPQLGRNRWTSGEVLEQMEEELVVEKPAPKEEDEFFEVNDEKHFEQLQTEGKLAYPYEERKTEPTYFLERIYRFSKRLERDLGKLTPGTEDYKMIEERMDACNKLVDAYEQPIVMPPLGDESEKGVKADLKKDVSYWKKVNVVTGYTDFKKEVARTIRQYNYLQNMEPPEKQPQTFICLLGKPGVGKSMISEIIAKALRRPFIQINMAGQTSPTFLLGNESSFKGATFGRIVKGIISATYAGKRSKGAVILLDEFEKVKDENVLYVVGNLFDRALNKNFQDAYLENICDLSEIFWIATANYSEKVPDFVRSRCKFVDITLLTYKERIEIARKELKEYWDKYKMASTQKFGGETAPGLPISVISDKLLRLCVTEEWGVRGIIMNVINMVSTILDFHLKGKMIANARSGGLDNWINGGKEREGNSTIKLKYANGEELVFFTKRDTEEDPSGKILSVLNQVEDWQDPLTANIIYDKDWMPKDDEGEMTFFQEDYEKVQIKEIFGGGTGRFESTRKVVFEEPIKVKFQDGFATVEDNITHLFIGANASKELGLTSSHGIPLATNLESRNVFRYVRKEFLKGSGWVGGTVAYRQQNILKEDEWTKLPKRT